MSIREIKVHLICYYDPSDNPYVAEHCNHSVFLSEENCDKKIEELNKKAEEGYFYYKDSYLIEDNEEFLIYFRPKLTWDEGK